jgi:2-polyprenyl-3-methyl-5-hydroxy-6-metoxy-1,4-benzoquinol methylase
MSLWRRFLKGMRPPNASNDKPTDVIATAEVINAAEPDQPAPEPLAPPPLREVRTVAELDEMLKEVDAAHAVSSDALLAKLHSFRFVADPNATSSDPLSDEYARYQMSLYELIAGRSYRVENERSDFIVESHKSVPFPYYTESWQIVSDHLLMLGLIVKTLRLPAKASILEFGSGWGNTTVALAQMGYRVTAVDIDERFLDIVRHRSRDLPSPPRLVAGDFSSLKGMDERFDAILFYESFHHCSDHRALIDSFADHLTPGGQVAFASEPITDTFTAPWGLRLDGQSVWSTRRFGWLELGFTETYFREVLGRAGYVVDKHVYPVTGLGTIFVARLGAQSTEPASN